MSHNFLTCMLFHSGFEQIIDRCQIFLYMTTSLFFMILIEKEWWVDLGYSFIHSKGGQHCLSWYFTQSDQSWVDVCFKVKHNVILQKIMIGLYLMRPECLLTYAMERMVDYYHNGKDIIKHWPLKRTTRYFRKWLHAWSSWCNKEWS